MSNYATLQTRENTQECDREKILNKVQRMLTEENRDKPLDSGTYTELKELLEKVNVRILRKNTYHQVLILVELICSISVDRAVKN